MNNLNEVKSTFEGFIARFNASEKELDEIMNSLSVKELMNERNVKKAVDERVEIYKELMKIDIEFDIWSTKVGLTIEQINEWLEETDMYCSKWYDWSSNGIAYRAMMKTIKETKESEINEMINNARKVLNLVGCTDENDCYEVCDCLSSLERINKNIRNEIFDHGFSVFAVDMLENRNLYHPYRECFMMGVLKVLKLVDDIFLELGGEC